MVKNEGQMLPFMFHLPLILFFHKNEMLFDANFYRRLGIYFLFSRNSACHKKKDCLMFIIVRCLIHISC